MRDFARKQIIQLEERYTEILKQRGEEAMNDGDGWHDGAFVASTNSVEIIYRQIEFIRAIMPLLEEIQIPNQCEDIQEGHVVEITLEDDYGMDNLKVLIVPSGTTEIIQKAITDSTLKVISADTPLARSILGKRRGSRQKYEFDGQKHIVSINDSESAISIYYGFAALSEA